MNYTGLVKDGVVIFVGPARPQEGAAVHVEEISPMTPLPPTWGEVFRDVIGAVDGLPTDLAENHDHYIHGTPKR